MNKTTTTTTSYLPLSLVNIPALSILCSISCPGKTLVNNREALTLIIIFTSEHFLIFQRIFSVTLSCLITQKCIKDWFLFLLFRSIIVVVSLWQQSLPFCTFSLFIIFFASIDFINMKYLNFFAINTC